MYRAEMQELRMVLVGRTGAGKSNTGNTLLGRKVFHCEMSSVSVTKVCQKETAKFEGQSLAVVDTPGLFDTSLTEEEVMKEIAKCVSFAAPGPHVFLVVIHPNRFTKEEEETVKNIQQLFGEKSADYTIALFTHGDDLEYEGVTVEKLINQNPTLLQFVRQCGGGYHVSNNRSKDPQQVRELLRKINQMVSNHGGRYYTNETLQGAEKAIKEEMERLQRENEELKQAEARRQAERKNRFITGCITGIFPGIGGVVGSIGGPAGALAGAAVGVVVGDKVGDAVGAAVGAVEEAVEGFAKACAEAVVRGSAVGSAAEKKPCSIQ